MTQVIYQSLVLTNIQNIIARVKCICLSYFFIAGVVGYLPSSTQNNIAASDLPLAWLLRKFKTNLSIVGLRIHSPLTDVVMDPAFLEKSVPVYNSLAQRWLFAATLCSLTCWRLEPGS